MSVNLVTGRQRKKIAFFPLNFTLNIVCIVERDVCSCGPLIRVAGPGMEEGRWSTSLSFFFPLVKCHLFLMLFPLPKLPPKQGLIQAGNRSCKLSRDFLHGWQEPSHLSLGGGTSPGTHCQDTAVGRKARNQKAGRFQQGIWVSWLASLLWQVPTIPHTCQVTKIPQV